jgi:hypothetical protein
MENKNKIHLKSKMKLHISEIKNVRCKMAKVKRQKLKLTTIKKRDTNI